MPYAKQQLKAAKKAGAKKKTCKAEEPKSNRSDHLRGGQDEKKQKAKPKPKQKAQPKQKTQPKQKAQPKQKPAAKTEKNKVKNLQDKCRFLHVTIYARCMLRGRQSLCLESRMWQMQMGQVRMRSMQGTQLPSKAGTSLGRVGVCVRVWHAGG